MMPSAPQCTDCFIRQARDAARMAGLDEAAVTALEARVEAQLAQMPAALGAPIQASRIHALIRELSANPDPYREAKRRAAAQALALYPRLRAQVDAAVDPFATAVRLAIAGNIIDLGVGSDYDLEASIARLLTQPLALDQIDRLRAALDGAGDVLFLADNAGETVFDRLLLERIEAPVTYVVKSGPAVNDATRADAEAAGITARWPVIDHGAATLGTLLDQCSPAFRDRFGTADVVIAKGMANFESLENSRRRLFFLLQTKCEVVSRYVGVPLHSAVVLEDCVGYSGRGTGCR